MKNLMVRGAVGLGAILTVSMPAAALAATPQQIIDKGLNDFTFTTPSLASGEVKVNIADRDAGIRAPKSTAGLTLIVKERKIPVAGQAVPDTDGTIVVKKVEGTGAYAIPTIDNPGTIEFRIVNGVGYVRVKEASDGVRMFLMAKGVDPDAAIGAWVKIDPSELCAALGNACPDLSSISAMSVSMAQDISKLKPIQVLRTERRWTAANGDKMIRVRARVSPTAINTLQNREIAKIARTDKQRTAKIAEIRKMYTDLRVKMAKTAMAININLTKSAVERVEASTVQTENKQSCTMNAKTKKQVCKTIGSQTITTITGMNIAAGNVAPILAPEASMSAVSSATSALQALQGAM